MARIWKFRIALLLAAAGLASPAWAETIEFVTYYPSPAAQGNANMQAAAVGNGYNGTVPDDGELLVFDRLGVGPGFSTAQPLARLQVVSTNAVNGEGVSVTGSAPRLMVIDTATGRIGGFGMASAAGNYGAETLAGDASLYAQGGNLRFGTGAVGANPTVRMSLLNNGNVGIGTTAPTVKLEIAQNNAIRLGNAYISSGTGDYAHFANNEWYNGTTWQTTAAGALIQLTGQNTYFYRHDAVGNHTASAVINQSGNVGIGTTAPTQRLHVYEPNANIWTANIQGNTYGLYASGSTYGVYGQVNSAGGIGVYGTNSYYGTVGGCGWGSYGAYGQSPYSAVYGYNTSYGTWAHLGYYNLGLYASAPIYCAQLQNSQGYVSYLAYSYWGLYTNGYIYGSWACSKDFKKNIVTLSPQEEASILSWIEKLPTVHYLYKMDKDEHAPRLGVIAETMPKDVTSEDGKGLEPAAYTAFSLVGVKALSTRVRRQQETIERQQRELQELKRRLEQIEKEQKR